MDPNMAIVAVSLAERQLKLKEKLICIFRYSMLEAACRRGLGESAGVVRALLASHANKSTTPLRQCQSLASPRLRSPLSSPTEHHAAHKDHPPCSPA
jgi:hypothetical protein